MENEKQVEIFTDGACSGNPGPGGWAALLRFGDREKMLSGAERETTNNRMELKAAIRGLQGLTRSCKVQLTTDSIYVKDGIEKWLTNWKKNNWKTANRKPVKNKDLWLLLDDEVQKHQVEWSWVKGHSGHEENERVDAAARQAIDDKKWDSE